MLQPEDTGKIYGAGTLSPVDIVNYAYDSSHLDLFAEQIK